MTEQKWERLQPTFSLEDERLEAFKQIVPEAFADGKIDFDSLRELLGETVEDSDEHFGLNWTGKSEARRLAGMPSKGTLVPVPGKGLHEDTTQNIFIEGDNLEVLKLLHKSYRGRIKMIYIDPPYNTGNDFIYKDDYRMPLESYLERSGQKSEAGELLTSNPKSSGRFHSDWLNMMYPRIRVAFDLLRDDGVIFVSIDDNEVHNLRQLLGEIFGEENFISQIIWERAYSPVNLKKHFSENHDYILCFAKNIEFVTNNGLKRSDEANARYSNPDNDSRGVWKSSDLSVGPAVQANIYEITTPSGRIVLPPSGYSWRLNKARFQEFCEDNRIWFGVNNDATPSIKRFLTEVKNTVTPMTIWKYSEVGHSQEAAQSLKRLFDGSAFFDYPKPVNLIKRCLELYSDDDSIIVDFFAGSGTTAEAVFELNKDDGGKRRFICVQLDERLKENSEAFKAGFKTISEVAAERIRRASKKVENETDESLFANGKPDAGFSYHRLEKSNFTAWSDYSGNDLDQLRGLLQSQLGSTFVDGSPDDAILTEIMLLEGFPLTSILDKDNAFQKNVIRRIESPLSEHRLFVTLDKEILEETIRQADELEKIDIFICLDSALTDRDKVRLADICRLKTI